MNNLNFTNSNKYININDDDLKNAPFKTNDSSNPESDNGLITSIWGPHEWEAFHAKTFGYPIKPSDEEKENYLQYYTLLGYVLPCIHCRRSYQEFIKTGDTKLSIDTVESRETLTKWGFLMHQAVNNKLGVDYGDTYEEMCYKYESYRARCDTNKEKGCIMPLNLKAKSYQNADIHRAPIINIKYSRILSERAHTLGLKNYDKFVNYYSSLKRNTKEWSVRDCASRSVIKYMRKNGIPALDSNNLPSVYEMLLISMLCSTLEKNQLDDIYSKLSSSDQ